MKYLLLLLLVACGSSDLSDKDKHTINSKLIVHNMSTDSEFIRDSLAWAGGTDRAAKIFNDKWNGPYDIKKDRNVTLEEWLSFCKEHDRDPVEFLWYLD